MFDESQQDRLRLELKMLHELLENVEEVGSGTKDTMQLLATDINRLLEQEAEADDKWTLIGKRWREVLLDFESHHPRLTQVVDQITSALANAGI